MSQCLFCENSLEIYCQECQESYCHHCGIIKHLRNGLIQPHVINYLCEECEEEVSSAYCKSCEQNLCPNCDTKIHNKGKRAQHTREPIANCLCMKDVKLVANLTLNFLKEYCDIEDTEKFTEQLDEISNNIFKGQKDKNDQNIIYISVLDNDSGDIPPEELKALIEALKQIRIKNFLIFESRCSEEDYASFKQNLAREPSLNSRVLNDAYKIYQILKDVKGIECIYVFDTRRNESIASALKIAPNLEEKKYLLNFDAANPQPFEASLHSPFKGKEEKGHAPQGIVPPIQVGNSFGQKQKVISEPFLPQQILGIQQMNSADRHESAAAKDLDYSDYWGQVNSSREEYRKNNQSYEEILLNMSSDQIYQKKSTPSMKAHPQYPPNLRKPAILNDQPLKNIELAGSQKLSHFIQQELRRFANKGDLLIMRDELMSKLTKFVQTSKLNCKVDDLLKQAEEVKIIHTTIRKFLETNPIAYIGMLLDSLTTESLIWIVKSIKNDLMTPTEKLILSRIKECYGLKIEQNLWKSIVNYIMANQGQKPAKASSFDQSTMFPLYVNKILDPVTNTDTFVIYLTHDGWTPEDQGIVEENTEEWKEFLTFINNFFREDENSIDQKSGHYAMKPSEADSQDLGKKATWSSSVENVLNRSTNKKDKALKISEDVKAIPGGRYGCAQFIKICGPEVLKKLSIGRLTLFVQEAINKGILRYQRTLLVKNNPNDSISTLTEVEGVNNSFNQDPNMEKKTKLIKTVKDVLVEILSENPEGVPLAQIPLHLKRKMDYVVNFQDLGFPKLKNFLATLPELVKIESSGTNHAFVKLKNPASTASRKNLSYKDQIFLPESQESTGQSYGTISQNQGFQASSTSSNMVSYEQANIDLIKYNSAMAINKYSALTPSSDKNPKGSRKKVSSLDDYLNKVRGFIELILTDNCYGISIQKLYNELSSKLNCEFDVRLFHCKDFPEFLTTHVENLVDIEIKRNVWIIYPKNFRFGPQTLVNVINIDSQRASVKNSEFGEPVLDNKRAFLPSQFNPNIPYQMNKGPGPELEAPPGLVKPVFKPIPAAFSAPFNPPGYPGNYPQGPSGQQSDTRSNNMSNIIPGAFYSAIDDNDGMSERFLPPQSQSNSYWKGTDVSSRSQAMNGGLHSRTDSRILKNQLQEESNLEIRDQLRFIEELLQGDANEKSMTNFTLDRTTESSFGGFQSPNLSFTTVINQGNQTSKQNHSKTQSEDFSNKNILKFPTGGHGRVYSAITERKNE